MGHRHPLDASDDPPAAHPVDTSQPVCSQGGRDRGWLGWGHRRATGPPYGDSLSPLAAPRVPRGGLSIPRPACPWPAGVGGAGRLLVELAEALSRRALAWVVEVDATLELHGRVEAARPSRPMPLRLGA